MTSNKEIAEFVNSLSTKDLSFARRAFAYTFIQENRNEIEKYIELRITNSGSSLSTIKWAEKIRKILFECTSFKPINQYYDSNDATLKPARSFQLSGNPSFSLTFNSPKLTFRIIGYLCTISILVFLAYLSFQIISAFQSFDEKRSTIIKHALP